MNDRKTILNNLKDISELKVYIPACNCHSGSQSEKCDCNCNCEGDVCNCNCDCNCKTKSVVIRKKSSVLQIK
jgi:hypothetical protein